MNETKREILKIIGDAIREYRLERGLTQDRFVEMYNAVNPQAIRIKKKNLSKWEHGDSGRSVLQALYRVRGNIETRLGWRGW